MWDLTSAKREIFEDFSISLYVCLFISFSSFNIFNILYFYFSQFEVDISIIIRLPLDERFLRSIFVPLTDPRITL